MSPNFQNFGPKFLIMALISIFVFRSETKVVPLDGSNFDEFIAKPQIVIVNFYADWCRFSQILMPIFEETSTSFENNTNVAFGSVDCDRKPGLAQKYNINKFPTLKYWRFGQISKREYRGSRSVEAMTSFINENLKPVFITMNSPGDLIGQLDFKKRSIIGYFNDENSVELENLRKIAANLREDCKFYVGIGQNFNEELSVGNKIAFLPVSAAFSEKTELSGNFLNDFNYLTQWVTDKCIPLVRELTFENAEELTEEGLPFLILFRKSDDNEILDQFTKEVAAQINDHKPYINFLVADGEKFAHPLYHLGKSKSDLPLIAIDSFSHMYLFPDIKRLSEPGVLKQFVMDLYSGKLHREFHHGPDPDSGTNGNTLSAGDQTTPPESVFKNLKPSHTRYTIMRDEL